VENGEAHSAPSSHTGLEEFGKSHISAGTGRKGILRNQKDKGGLEGRPTWKERKGEFRQLSATGREFGSGSQTAGEILMKKKRTGSSGK